MSDDNLVGQRFGFLTVIEDLGRTKKKSRRIVKAICECGAEKTYRLDTLKAKGSRRTVSCGCKKGGTEPRHGHNTKAGPSRTYSSWQSMITRCTNKRCHAYPRYGGRGIKVCGRWMVFDNFLSDMGEIPDRQTLGRIDNDGDYCPENCRWETYSQQNRNRNNNAIIEMDGVSRCQAEWEEVLGLPRGIIHQRLKAGWSEHDALHREARRAG